LAGFEREFFFELRTQSKELRRKKLQRRNYDMTTSPNAKLQDRFIDFAVQIIALYEHLPATKAGLHVGGQILRSGTSPAPNYAEAQSAESVDDFIHKLKIALKELRETEVWLKIIQRANLVKPSEALLPVLQENNELIAILVASVNTARRNKVNKNNSPNSSS